MRYEQGNPDIQHITGTRIHTTEQGNPTPERKSVMSNKKPLHKKLKQSNEEVVAIFATAGYPVKFEDIRLTELTIEDFKEDRLSYRERGRISMRPDILDFNVLEMKGVQFDHNHRPCHALIIDFGKVRGLVSKAL